MSDTDKAKRLIDDWFVSTLSPRKWRTLKTLLEQSREARVYYDKVAAARAVINRDDGLDDSRVGMIGEALFERLTPAKKSYQRMWLMSAVATAAIVLVAVLPRGADEFRSRGATPSDLGLRAFCIGRDANNVVRAVASSDTQQAAACNTHDSLQLSYTVRSTAAADLRWVFLVGVDSDHRALWYFPQPSEERSVGVTVGEERVMPGAIDLAVNHRAGVTYIYALFSDVPLTVENVSRWLESTPAGTLPKAGALGSGHIEARVVALELSE